MVSEYPHSGRDYSFVPTRCTLADAHSPVAGILYTVCKNVSLKTDDAVLCWSLARVLKQVGIVLNTATGVAA